MVFLGILSAVVLAYCEEENELGEAIPEALQDLQTEFWLPYSVTEDVDFTLVRPETFGCYQWSVEEDKMDFVNLDPVIQDYKLRCGNKLDFQILPKGEKESIDIKITAENLYTEETDNYIPGVPNEVEYILHIRTVAKLEVMGLRTELHVGGESAPFGVAGYDAEENEFDTLDGLQINWYIGSKRQVAEFEKYMQKGPITKVIPVGAGSGKIIALITDPNYRDKLEMATIDITVTSQFRFEPDAVYLLEGASVKMKVLEQFEDKAIEVVMGKEGQGKDEFYLDVKNPEIVSINRKTGELKALVEGETTLFVKDKEGEVIKGQPIWVARPKKLVVNTYPYPESKQLIINREYDIKIDIYDKDDHLIYPSKNIMAWTQFPPNLEVLEVDESMLHAKVRTKEEGLAKVKVALRSVLDDDYEETEILPHIKMSKDFEVFEPIIMHPLFSILPWDENKKTSYDLFFEAKGGSKVYEYSVSDPELAAVDNAGKVTTHSGPGEFDVKAYMPKSPNNFFEARVSILPPIRLEFTNQDHEYQAGNTVQIKLKMTTFLPEDGEEIMYTSCADVPYEIELSDKENFEIINRSNRTNPTMLDSCAFFTLHVKPKVVEKNLKCTIKVKYFEPSSGRTLRAKTVVQVYNKLEGIYPEKRKTDSTNTIRRVFLPVGSSMDVAFRGGPYPRFGQPLDHFMKVIDDAPETIRAVRNEEACGKVDSEAQTWDDLNVVTVTCLKEGIGMFALMVGNYIREESKDAKPIRSHIETEVVCSIPHKISLLASGAQDNVAKHPKNGFMSVNNKDVDVLITVKNKDGQTFDTIESLTFDVKVDDEELLDVKKHGFVIPTKLFKTISIPDGKPYQTLKPKGKDGTVEVSIKLKGYNEDVLAKNEVKNPPALPKVLDEEEMDEEEEPIDEANYSTTLIDYVSVNLVSMQEIEKIKKQNP